MAITNMYTLYAININKTSDVLIPQITDWSLDPGLTEILEGSDGEVDDRYVAVNEQRPIIRFTTTDLETLLGLAGISGRAIDVDTPSTLGSLEAWFQLLAEGSTRASGSTHTMLTINEGILIPRTISANQGARATISCEAHATYDGTNDPIVIAGSQPLTGTPGTASLWTLGPVSINGTPINGVVACTIDFGINLIVEGSDGEYWPRYAGIMSRRPSITFTTPDVGIFSTLGITGAAQTTDDSFVYLRKLAEGATRVAENAAGHIKIGIDEGRISVFSITGSHGQRLGAQVRITPTYDGTAAILAITTNTTI